ncbi:MAG: low-specificity L-threonine aldolase [Candidatus Bathyarchaeia archaeon]|jgi:threonine aldolase
MPISEIIDLRSDTVTLPTDEMLEAIKQAKLGDDVYGEDPTVNKLQEMAAEKMGKEAALLVPSGTQANLTSVMSNCQRGELVLLEAESHIYWYEVGGIAAIAGLLPWLIKAAKATFEPQQLESALRPENIHYPVPSLVCVENTHNRYGGKIVTPSQLEAISEVAKKHSLKVYMDGARIFNAAVALNVDVKEFTKHVDNLMFCLSKGLSCPVGSIIVGNRNFIDRARKNRKILGGGMRQAGIIAAPGIIALEKMVDRLKIDHENAKLLAEKLTKISRIHIDLENVQTNMVTFDLDLSVDCDAFLQKLKESGVLALAQAKNRVRMVTHRGIEREHIETAAATIDRILNRN